MKRIVLAMGLLALLPLDAPVVAPVLAATAKQKMETCKAGADHEKLTGAKRKTFMSRCMAPSDAPAKRAKKPQAA